jgi:hypothetical protein
MSRSLQGKSHSDFLPAKRLCAGKRKGSSIRHFKENRTAIFCRRSDFALASAKAMSRSLQGKSHSDFLPAKRLCAGKRKGYEPFTSRKVAQIFCLSPP